MTSKTIIDRLRELEELTNGKLSVEEEIDIIIHNIASIQKRIEKLEEEDEDD